MPIDRGGDANVRECEMRLHTSSVRSRRGARARLSARRHDSEAGHFHKPSPEAANIGREGVPPLFFAPDGGTTADRRGEKEIEQMCGSTAAEHTCGCCSPEGRRRRARSRLQRRRHAAGQEVRPYRRRVRERTARPGVVTENGWAVELQSDPRTAEAQARLGELGTEARDSQGRIIWGTVADPRLRALRAYDGAAGSRPSWSEDEQPYAAHFRTIRMRSEVAVLMVADLAERE